MHQMKILATQMTCNCGKMNEAPDLTRSFSYTSDNGLCKYETSTCRSKVVATGSSNQINRWQEKLSSGASDLYLQFSVRIPGQEGGVWDQEFSSEFASSGSTESETINHAVESQHSD